VLFQQRTRAEDACFRGSAGFQTVDMPVEAGVGQLQTWVSGLEPQGGQTLFVLRNGGDELILVDGKFGGQLPGDVLSEEVCHGPPCEQHRNHDPCQGSKQQATPQGMTQAAQGGPHQFASHMRYPRPRTVSIAPGGSFLRSRPMKTSMVLESRSKSCA